MQKFLCIIALATRSAAPTKEAFALKTIGHVNTPYVVEASDIIERVQEFVTCSSDEKCPTSESTCYPLDSSTICLRTANPTISFLDFDLVRHRRNMISAQVLTARQCKHLSDQFTSLHVRFTSAAYNSASFAFNCLVVPMVLVQTPINMAITSLRIHTQNERSQHDANWNLVQDISVNVIMASGAILNNFLSIHAMIAFLGTAASIGVCVGFLYPNYRFGFDGVSYNIIEEQQSDLGSFDIEAPLFPHKGAGKTTRFRRPFMI